MSAIGTEAHKGQCYSMADQTDREAEGTGRTVTATSASSDDAPKVEPHG